MKIAIIGYSGSGKSTLANFLGQHYNCKVLHLDKIHFTSNWQERTVDEMTDDISTFMLQRYWIIEGIIIWNNSRLDKQARKVLFKVSSFLEK